MFPFVYKEEAIAYAQTHTHTISEGYRVNILPYYLLLGRRSEGKRMRNNFHSIPFDIFGILKHVKVLPVQKINLNKTLILSN